uniref:EF-hand domain-containing protein n=1 Tax=Xiphophorus couchianus TaxID=32473 RepID=A0A3B5LZP7_9TELE
MASWGKFTAVFRNVVRSSRVLKTSTTFRAIGSGVLGSVVGTGGLCYYLYHHANVRNLPFAVLAEEEKLQEPAAPQLSARKVRFTQFASVMYDMEPYMTPRDFLFSVMLEQVDRKLKKRILTTQDVDKMLATASKARPGSDLFRKLGDNGLISYTEYLFLLTILTSKLTFPKGVNTFARKSLEGAAVNTSLQAYFFGKRGDNKLKYQEFRRFMEDLQAEVQEMEFLQFSRGMDTMRREDFAEWLLHYTNEEDNEIYWENMRKKIPAGQSITFEEFKAFCLFTNNLEDFAFSMKMVTEANRPVGIAQFKRAVKIATGHELSENVLDTVFKLFDLDGDDCLSHKEFMGVMTDRVLRGLKVQQQTGISGYWKCVKRETLKGAKEALGDISCPI